MIVRIHKENNFSIISNEAIRRPDLSARAKGLFCYMISMPNDWHFHADELSKHFTEGRDAIRNALKELESLGYLMRRQAVDSKNRFTHNLWALYEHSQTSPWDARKGILAPLTENPSTESPFTENPTLLSTYSTKDLVTNSPSEQDPKEEAVTYHPVEPTTASKKVRHRASPKSKYPPEIQEVVSKCVTTWASARKTHGFDTDGPGYALAKSALSKHLLAHSDASMTVYARLVAYLKSDYAAKRGYPIPLFLSKWPDYDVKTPKVPDAIKAANAKGQKLSEEALALLWQELVSKHGQEAGSIYFRKHNTKEN